jgi:hypothetical protein
LKKEGRRPVAILRRTWKNNIEMVLKEIECEVAWIHLAHDTDQWQALMNTVMTLRIRK